MLHFVITLAAPNGLVATFSATYTPRSGMTRADVYNDLLKWAINKMGRTDVNVVFFALEPNELQPV